MIRSVIFDLDGTLLDRSSSLYQFVVNQYERIIKHAKHLDKDRFISRYIELDNRGYVWKDKVYIELIKEFDLPFDWQELLTDYNNEFYKHVIPFPNTIEILDKLKERGYKLGMITNGLVDLQSSNIRALGIEKYFDVILISEREGISKPDPAIFLKAAHSLSVLPEECVYVGDNPTNDVTGSMSAGMKAIWKEDTFYGDQFDYDGMVRDLLEVETIIERWNQER